VHAKSNFSSDLVVFFISPYFPTGSDTGTASGVQTDMYLYVTSNNLYCESGVSAFAISCMYDYATNRPVLANLNLCYAAVVNQTRDKLIATTVHELIHTLGFSSSMFNLYIDSNGNEIGAASVSSFVPAMPSSSMRSNYTMVVTPNVVKEVSAG